MDILIIVWNIVGGVATSLVIITAIMGTYYSMRGFVPAAIRLGNGLWRRKIAICASGDSLISLESLLRDTKLFNRKNIIRIGGVEDIEAVERASILLMYWPDWRENFQLVLDRKSENTALVIYAPRSKGSISEEDMSVMETKKNIVINNFRGRLLNDIVICMITTTS